LNIKIKEDDKNKKLKEEYIVIAIDSTCIKVINIIGQWIQDK